MIIEYPIRYPTGAPITITTENPISKPTYQPRSHPDSIKRGIQESQVILQRNIILFIHHTISSSSSRQEFTQTFLWGSMILSYIRVYKVCYETSDLFSSTKSQIYNKDKREWVKVVILYKPAMDLNILLFEAANLKIGRIRKYYVTSTYVQAVAQIVSIVRAKNNVSNQYFWSHSFWNNVTTEKPIRHPLVSISMKIIWRDTKSHLFVTISPS